MSKSAYGGTFFMVGLVDAALATAAAPLRGNHRVDDWVNGCASTECVEDVEDAERARESSLHWVQVVSY